MDGYLEGSLAVPLLTQTLHDPYNWIRNGAVRALRLIKDPKTVPSLLPLLQDDNRQVTRETVKTLRAIGDNQAVTSLIQLLQEHSKEFIGGIRAEDHLFLREIIETIRIIGGDLSREFLQQASQHENTWVRKVTKEVLRKRP